MSSSESFDSKLLETSYTINEESGQYVSASHPEKIDLCNAISNLYRTPKKSVDIVCSGLNAINLILQSTIINFGNDITILVSSNVYSPTKSKVIKCLQLTYPNVVFKICNIFDNPYVLKDPKIKVLFLEFCTNPDGQVFDYKWFDLLPKNTYVIVDNTWLTVYGFNPLKTKYVDCVVETTAKYLSGGLTPGGVVIFKKGGKIKDTFNNLVRSYGIHICPIYCKMLLQTIKTIEHRIKISSIRTKNVLEYLKTNDKVVKINHPLTNVSNDTLTEYYKMIKLDMAKYPPSVIYFKVIMLNKKIIDLKDIVCKNNFRYVTSYGHSFDTIDPYPDYQEDSNGFGVFLRLAIGYNVYNVNNVNNINDKNDAYDKKDAYDIYSIDLINKLDHLITDIYNS